MITIPVSELLRFMPIARHIKASNRLPIYSYVKLACEKDSGTFYKSNSDSFVVCPVQLKSKESITILLDELSFFGFISQCEEEFATITIDGNKAKMVCGSKKGSCQTVDPDHYPMIQERGDGAQVELDTEVLSALSLAKAHVLQEKDKAMRAWNTFVHIAKHKEYYYIAAFNGFTAYIQKFKTELPVMVLDAETISVISKRERVVYSQAGNYDIFDFGDAIYGFIKAEQKVVPMDKVLENFGNAENYFCVDRKKMVAFCEWVISISSSNIPPTVLVSDGKNGSIQMNYDGMLGESAEEIVGVEDKKKGFQKLQFQPKNLLLTMRELSYDKVIISHNFPTIVIKTPEDESYTGAIIEVEPLKN